MERLTAKKICMCNDETLLYLISEQGRGLIKRLPTRKRKKGGKVQEKKYRKIGIFSNYGDFEHFLVLFGP